MVGQLTANKPYITVVKSLTIQIHVACITKVLYTLYIKKERLLIYTFEKRLIVS